MGLDFAGALEDVEDASVGQQAAGDIFHGEAVAAVDLQGVVGGGPGHAGGDQLGHAGLQVAALALVLLAGGEIGQLAHAHDLGGHHGQLVVDAGKLEDRLAELLAVQGVA